MTSKSDDTGAGRPGGLSSCGSSQQAVSPVPASIPDALNVVFSDQGGPMNMLFVEVETTEGRGIKAGEWAERLDGLWELRLRWTANREMVEALRTYRDYVADAANGHSEAVGVAPELQNKLREMAREDLRRIDAILAQAIEARRAETTGSVHESAVRQDAPEHGRED